MPAEELPPAGGAVAVAEGPPAGRAAQGGSAPPAGRAALAGSVPSAGRASQSGPATRRRMVWATPRRLARVAAYLVAGIGLFLCYQLVSGTQPVSPDGSSNALEAWAMLHGNVLLSGWTLTDVSFYTTELPEYMLAELIRGLSPAVIQASAAFTYTLLVLLAGLVAKGRAKGREGVVRVLIGSGLMLAPQLGAPVHVLLSAPDHVGTGVPLLATFLVLDRAPKRWYTPPLIALMLTWTVIGDRLAVAAAAIPLAAVCAIRVIRRRVRDGAPLAAQWFEMSLIAAGIVSVGISTLVPWVIGRAGGFTLLPVTSAQVASPSVMPDNFRLTGEGVLGLYGADFVNAPHGLQLAVALLHLAGVALVAWAVARALRRFFRCYDLLVQVLTVAILVNLAAYLFSTLPYDNIWDTRQISAVLPFGAVLAGRLLAADLIRARLVPALVMVLACYAAALGFSAAQLPVPPHDLALADWLVAHDLKTGLSVYDESNITTLESDGRVQLLPTAWERTQAVPRAYQSDASWYDPRLNYADYVVNTGIDGYANVIPYQDLLAAFGRPAQTYRYGPYVITVWHKNLLDDLGGPPSH
jgi:hypothetical protein